MKKAAICFTEDGKALIEKLNCEARKAGIEEAELYRMGSGASFTQTLSEWTREQFALRHALIFVCAAGIAVRAVSGVLKDKLTDSPVIVIDDLGRFVIPILSGHAGGADKLAATIAALIDAVPVITTSTDIHGAFSADVFAKEYALRIRNREGIKQVSAKAIEGKAITISVKDYPPKEKTDIIIADETDREYSLLLSPKPYTVGIGLKKDKDPEETEQFFLEVLTNRGISVDSVYALCTIDCKEEERALEYLRDKYALPLISFDAALLNKAPGKFTGSAFVEKTVGTDNVCERAALLGAGGGAELILRKQTGRGLTAAIAKRRGL